MKDLEAIKETKTETDVMLLASVSFLFGFGVGLLLGLWWGRFSGVLANSSDHNSEFSAMLKKIKKRSAFSFSSDWSNFKVLFNIFRNLS